MSCFCGLLELSSIKYTGFKKTISSLNFLLLGVNTPNLPNRVSKSRLEKNSFRPLTSAFFFLIKNLLGFSLREVAHHHHLLFGFLSRVTLLQDIFIGIRSMPHQLALLIALLSVLIHHDPFCQAFPVTNARSDVRTASFRDGSQTTALFLHAEDEHGDFFDVEKTRRQLESLVTEVGGSSAGSRSLEEASKPRPAFSSSLSSASPPSSFEKLYLLPETPILDVTLPPRGPMTTIERERRTAELELLANLDKGDESLEELWELWFSEKGSHAGAMLHRADDLMNDGAEHFAEAENILRSLIEEHGVYFAEPLNRMATIYHLQGRMEEALTLNKMVLSVKPWHFGALSHIVMVYAALKDSQSARQWAAFRLPTFDPNASNKRRKQWVERAVAEAAFHLNEREETITQAFGKKDDEWIQLQQHMRHMYENDADAWQ